MNLYFTSMRQWGQDDVDFLIAGCAAVGITISADDIIVDGVDITIILVDDIEDAIHMQVRALARNLDAKVIVDPPADEPLPDEPV